MNFHILFFTLCVTQTELKTFQIVLAFVSVINMWQLHGISKVECDLRQYR